MKKLVLATVAAISSISYAQGVRKSAMSDGLTAAQESSVVKTAEVSSDATAIENASLVNGERPADDLETRMRNWMDGKIYINGAWIDDESPSNGRKVCSAIKDKGGVIIQGIALVGLDPSNPNYGKARALAYEKAINNARSSFLITYYMKNITDILGKLVKNGDTPSMYNPEKPSNQTEEIEAKLMAVTGAKLDKLLDEAGVDKAKYEQAPKSKRSVMLHESLTKKAMTTAFGELSGMITLHTFQSYRIDPGKGEKSQALGVICAVTPSMKQFAFDVLHARGDIIPSKKPGKDLEAYYRHMGTALVDEFGVRKMRDEHGNPVLVAFGQWSSSKRSSNPTLNLRYQDAATRIAASLARSELALFLKSCATFENPAEVGSVFEDATLAFDNGEMRNDSINNILENVDEKIKVHADITVYGLRELHSWQMPHPDNPQVLLCGSVLAWSPRYEKESREISRPPVTTPPSQRSAAVDVAPKTSAGAMPSRDSNDDYDVDDF